jgi:hypothetical protein
LGRLFNFFSSSPYNVKKGMEEIMDKNAKIAIIGGDKRLAEVSKF